MKLRMAPRSILAFGILTFALGLIWGLTGLPSVARACDDGDGDHGGGTRCPVKVTGAVFTTDEFGSVVNGNLYQSALDVYLRVGAGNGYALIPSTGNYGRDTHRERNGDKRKSGKSKYDSDKDCDKSKSKSKDCDDRSQSKKGKSDTTRAAYSGKSNDREKHDDCDRYGGKSGKCDAGEGEPSSHGRPSSLPDGLYYFQVTDPSGKTLLSLDAIESRQFEVVDGYIQAVYGSHNFNVLDDPFPLNYTVVQLTPYLPTPNRGGEYKVWVTPVAAYRAGQGYHGFIPNCSKTDNFKVRSDGNGAISVFLSGSIFWDISLDGTWNTTGSPPESPQPNVVVNVFAQGAATPTDSIESSTTGQWGFQLVPPSLPVTYRVEPVLTGGSMELAPTFQPAYDVTFTTSGQVVENKLFGVVGIGDSGANIRFTPAFWANPGSKGVIVMDAYWEQAYDPDSPPAFLSAPLLQQCLGGSSLTSAEAMRTFLLANASETSICQMASLWLALNLAIATNGILVDPETSQISDGQVLSVTGNEVIYLGLDLVSGPRYDTLGNLLTQVASGYANFTEAEAAFYLAALQQAVDNFSFVQAFTGEDGEF